MSYNGIMFKSAISKVQDGSTRGGVWMSLHLFYEGPWLDLLKHYIKPFLMTQINVGNAKSYFYVRYYEGGPHIRVRILIEKEKYLFFEQVVKDYFYKVQKILSVTRYVKNEFSEDSIANDFCRFINYEPEYERYGGHDRMSIAEDQFFLSSAICLDIIESTENYSQRMWKALSLQLAIYSVFKYSTQHVLSIIDAYTNLWSSDLFQEEDGVNSGRDIIHSMDGAVSLIPKQNIIAISKLWDEINSSSVSIETPAIVNLWLDGMKVIKEMLDLVSDNNTSTNYSGIIGSYIHMTNNRLGINNYDEIYLGRIISKGLTIFTE